MRLLPALIRALSWRKLAALLYAQYAYLVGRLLKINVKPLPPPFVTIEPTNRCNLRCPECVSGSGQLERAIGDMSLEQFKGLVNKIYSYTWILNLYMQGEPYLNKDLPEMIAFAKSKRLFVSLSTNAQCLPEFDKRSLPHHLIVSVDGATQESYAAYRKGGSLLKVKDFVRLLADWKKKTKSRLPFVELQFLLHRINEHEVQKTRTLFKGQFDRFVTKSMQIINEENREKFMPRVTNKNRYCKKRRQHRSCFKMLSTSVITQDGLLVLCCMDKNAKYVCGNLFNDDYVSLLRGDKSRRLRKMAIEEKGEIQICKNCPFA